MGKPLNWMLSCVPGRKSASRSLRQRLAATTILAVVPFLGYGRQAYADCIQSGSDVACSGSIAGDVIGPLNNANVSTSGQFEVTDDGLYISGDGQIRFTDNNAASITNKSGTALDVRSTGDITDGAVGSVTITTNATINGNGVGIYAYNDGSGDISITAGGQVTGVTTNTELSSDGIYAYNRESGNNLYITTGANSVITGGDNGIDARNYGRGYLDIDVQGDVKSNKNDGIYARNHGDDLLITIGSQATVDGAGNGIQVRNLGFEDDIDIQVDGSVRGRGVDGIRAENGEDNANLYITTGASSTVVGGSNGIAAINRGYGNLAVEADGYVQGNNNDGIFAHNQGYNLTITTGARSIVRGGGHGIGAENFGSGDLIINANGLVAGYSEDDGAGIYAYSYEDSDALVITTGADSRIRGYEDGIHAISRSYDEDDGGMKITVDGVVTGRYGSGINARNGYSANYDDETEDYTALAITTGVGSVVTGAGFGIEARNRGGGKFTIEANGVVQGLEDDGIYAYNRGDGQQLIITAGSQSRITGFYGDGIDARQNGFGNLTITVAGTVTGTTEDGEGDAFGIRAEIDGFQTLAFDVDPYANVIEINVEGGGLVQGRTAGILANARNGNAIYISNDGIVRNLSGESADRAIVTMHGDTHVENNADLIGSVHFGAPEGDEDPFAGKDSLDNHGVWNLAGSESDFGANPEFFGDRLGNTGTILAADDKTTAEVSRILGLELFENDGGLISLVDGQEGDTFEIESKDGTEYIGTDGRLAVDTVLGPTPADPSKLLSDEFIINGSAEGTTRLHVNVVSANGANVDGIPVVFVRNGEADETAFVLNGPLYGGLYTWGLRFNDANPDDLRYELYTLTDANGNPIPGAGTYEFPAGGAATQDVWLQTANSVLQRQADLRSLLQGVGVTPVADFGEPVEATPLEPTITPGFWYKAFASYADLDDEQNGVPLDRTQTTYGGMAGMDFGTQDVGDALLFGVFGGYIVSDLNFNATSSDWNYEGPTVGAYVTYLNQALYVDATIKADFLDIDIDPDDLALGENDANTDAVNIGGLIEGGYKFGRTVYVEPQAALAVLHTEIDDVELFGATAEFEDETSVRGRLGLRLGVDHTHDDYTVYSADVTASVWENFTSGTDVNVVDPTATEFGVSDDPSSTYGDVSLGLSAANPDGWSAFMRANYLFAEDYEAVSGNAGVRISW